MEPRHARMSIEGCTLTPEGAIRLKQSLTEHMSWPIDPVVHLHSKESFTLTYTPPKEYWHNQAMFKELSTKAHYLTTGLVFEQTVEDTAFFTIERKQCPPGMTMDTPYTRERS